MKKEKGSITDKLPALLFLLCVVMLLITYGIRLRILKTSKSFLEDGLVASNLATLIIDNENYQNTGYFKTTGEFVNGEIILENPTNSYYALKETLKANLKLDNNMNSTNKELFDDFEIESFIVYEVKFKKDSMGNVIHTTPEGTELEDNKYIEMLVFDNDGNYTITELNYGSVKAPNDVDIFETTSYIKITFTVKNLVGKQNCKMENTVQAVLEDID